MSRTMGLLMLSCAMSMTGASVARASDAKPVDVILLVETQRGSEQGVLRKYRHAMTPSWLDKSAPARLGNLQQALGTEEVVVPLVMRLACPASTRREDCHNFQATLDVDFEDALANATASTVIVVRPEVGYWSKEHAYYVRYHVEIFFPTPASDQRVDGLYRAASITIRRFIVGYFDWNCAVDCLRAAQETAAQELADMVTYMRELSIGDYGSPAAWEKLPKLKQVDRWANDCPARVSGELVVREGERRFWLGHRAGRNVPYLHSMAWAGCNSYVPMQE